MKIRGAIEGFYGVYYTWPERESLIHFLGEHGYNLYIYGPKNDQQHRARWREPYPDEMMARFANIINISREAGVSFCYSLGPGIDIRYGSDKDFAAITAKLRAFYELGVRDFSLLLDDIATEFGHAEDKRRFGSYAEAHAEVTNRLYAWLMRLDHKCNLSMCPTDYHGGPPFSPYLNELGERLDAKIDVFYTGKNICSREISCAEVEAFSQVLRRAPLIWDNYPVNDLAMQAEMHIGPIRGRDPKLPEVAKGIVVNTMIQAEASKIPLLTFADYFADPEGYDPESSWERAFAKVGGEENLQALKLFGENSLQSCLGRPEAERLQGLAEATLSSLEQGEGVDSPEAAALASYLDELDEACYHLKYRMDNLALRNELLPWLELLECWLWTGRRALEVLGAKEQGDSFDKSLKLMRESLTTALHHPKRIAGRALAPLAEYVEAQVEA